MSRLAIIIPYMGNTTSLESTLASVLANRPEDCEVFVVLQRPYEDPYDIQGEVRFVSGDARGGVAHAVNLGVQQTEAPVIHVLLCGTEVQEGWADAAVARFRDPRIAAVAPLILNASDPERILAAGLAYHLGGAVVSLAEGSSRGSLGPHAKRVLAPHPAAAFYRKAILEAVGQFDTAVGDRLAGLDAGLTLQQLGWITVLEPACRVLVPCRDLLAASAWRQGLEAERLFWRWAPLLGSFRSAASHSALLAGEGLRGLLNLAFVPRWAGRMTGACAALVAPGHRRRIDALRRPPQSEPTSGLAAPHYRACQAASKHVDSESRKRAG